MIKIIHTCIELRVQQFSLIWFEYLHLALNCAMPAIVACNSRHLESSNFATICPTWRDDRLASNLHSFGWIVMRILAMACDFPNYQTIVRSPNSCFLCWSLAVAENGSKVWLIVPATVIYLNINQTEIVTQRKLAKTFIVDIFNLFVANAYNLNHTF